MERISTWPTLFGVTILVIAYTISGVNAALPLNVLSPVVGDLEQIVSFLGDQCSGTKWCFDQHQYQPGGPGTPGHGPGGGICQSDDTYAWDANLNTPKKDSDAGKPVYAVASGVVAQSYGGCINADTEGSFGQVLIEHVTFDGTTWWSGYLHMTNIQVTPGQTVTQSTVLGFISNVGVPDGNNHLHFVVYEGQNNVGGLISFNATIQVRIHVTTLMDHADSPFDADGLCPSAGTINDLPGADGFVSLREAIIAANNTAGAQTITFDPSLSSGTIAINFDDLDADPTPDPLPLLCGGDTTINGDLNGDSVPDITLDGSQLVTETDGGIFIISSNNTVNGLRVQNFPGVGVGVIILSTSNSTLTNAAITDNEVLGNSFVGILVTPFQGDNNTITGVTIAHNLVSGHNTTSLVVSGGWDGANGNIVDATITENTVTGNSFEGTAGIGVGGGILSSSRNQVTAQITNNTVVDNEGTGIIALVGQDNSSTNSMVVDIQGNVVEGNQGAGIAAVGGFGAFIESAGTSSNNVLDATIEQNTITSQLGVGIDIEGGIASIDGRAGTAANRNQVSATVAQNVVEDSASVGIVLIGGGIGKASLNSVNTQIEGSTVCGNVGADIYGVAGLKGSDTFPGNQGIGNRLTGSIIGNTATTIFIENGVPGNIAIVSQAGNTICPAAGASGLLSGEGGSKVKVSPLLPLKDIREAVPSVFP